MGKVPVGSNAYDAVTSLREIVTLRDRPQPGEVRIGSVMSGAAKAESRHLDANELHISLGGRSFDSASHSTSLRAGCLAQDDKRGCVRGSG
jgi:hypothetical protein